MAVTKDGIIRARVDKYLKKEAESIFEGIGMSPSEAIRIFYMQVKLNKGLPFEVKIPNEITRKTFEATDNGEELNTVETIEQLKSELNE